MARPFPSEQLPSGFRYPEEYLEILRGYDVRDDLRAEPLWPWLLECADSDAGQRSLTLGLRRNPPLVPFAFLDLGDGDTACFVGNDISGNPKVRMMIVDGSDREYGYPDFSAWYDAARRMSADFKPD
jgi:hypothetical protein